MALSSEILSEGLGITETLQCRIHEACVPQVTESCSSFFGWFYENKFILVKTYKLYFQQNFTKIFKKAYYMHYS